MTSTTKLNYCTCTSQKLLLLYEREYGKKLRMMQNCPVFLRLYEGWLFPNENVKYAACLSHIFCQDCYSKLRCCADWVTHHYFLLRVYCRGVRWVPLPFLVLNVSVQWMAWEAVKSTLKSAKQSTQLIWRGSRVKSDVHITFESECVLLEHCSSKEKG